MIDEIYEALRVDESVTIDSSIPKEVEKFMSMPSTAEAKDIYKSIEEAASKLKSELNLITRIEDDWQYVDDIHMFKKNFYNKYIDFAKKCQELSGLGGISGYGGLNDAIKIKIKNIARWVDYNFPYGWKR